MLSCLQGCVYTAYGIFVITLIPRFKNIENADNQGGFPDSWSHSGIGKFGYVHWVCKPVPRPAVQCTAYACMISPAHADELCNA